MVPRHVMLAPLSRYECRTVPTRCALIAHVVSNVTLFLHRQIDPRLFSVPRNDGGERHPIFRRTIAWYSWEATIPNNTVD